MNSKRTDWYQHIETQDKSKETAESYCKKRKLSYSMFKYWRTKYLREKSTSKKQFHQLPTPKQSQNNTICIELTLPHGMTLKITENSPC